MSSNNPIHTMKIKTGGCARFSNALHAQFHKLQYDLVTEFGPKKLKIPADLLKDWATNVDLEVDIEKTSHTSVHTAELRKKDKERDRLLRHIFGMIRAQKLSPFDDVRNAAEELDVALGPYSRIQTNSSDGETLHIISMRVDAEKYPDKVAKVGLTAVLKKLYEVNTEFEAARKARRNEQIENKLPGSKEIRPQTDRAFANVCVCVQSAHLIAGTNDERDLITTLINRMNRTALDLRTTHREIIAQRKRWAEEKESAAEEKESAPETEHESEDLQIENDAPMEPVI